MANTNLDSLIESAALHEIVQSNAKGICILDGTLAKPGSDENPRAAFDQARIPGAQFFDIKEISDQTSNLPNMLPNTDAFENAVSKLGVNNTDHIIVYGQSGMAMGPARVWWMFHCFGHQNVSLLNGGLPAWKAEGYELETGSPAEIKSSFFEAKFNPAHVRDFNDMLKAVNDPSTLILDARSADRFDGTTAEPRAGMRSGHIPGSQNIACGTLVDPQTGKLKPQNALEEIFKDTLNTQNRIATCGSGITACMLAFALHRLGHEHTPVYDGSWSEWGQDEKNTPIEQKLS